MNLCKIAAIVSFFVCLTSLSAEINVGAFGGLNSASLSGDKPSDWCYLSTSGFMGAIIGEVNVSKDVRISFQPGFIQKGTKIGIDIPGEPSQPLLMLLTQKYLKKL